MHEVKKAFAHERKIADKNVPL